MRRDEDLKTKVGSSADAASDQPRCHTNYIAHRAHFGEHSCMARLL